MCHKISRTVFSHFPVLSRLKIHARLLSSIQLQMNNSNAKVDLLVNIPGSWCYIITTVTIASNTLKIIRRLTSPPPPTPARQSTPHTHTHRCFHSPYYAVHWSNEITKITDSKNLYTKHSKLGKAARTSLEQESCMKQLNSWRRGWRRLLNKHSTVSRNRSRRRRITDETFGDDSYTGSQPIQDLHNVARPMCRRSKVSPSSSPWWWHW